MSDKGAWMRDPDLFWKALQKHDGKRGQNGKVTRFRYRPTQPAPVDNCPRRGGRRYRQERTALLRPERGEWIGGKPPPTTKSHYAVLVCTTCWHDERTC